LQAGQQCEKYSLTALAAEIILIMGVPLLTPFGLPSNFAGGALEAEEREETRQSSL
jgi:hypothetical protein